jgi:SAM-dependent methyltransferase
MAASEHSHGHVHLDEADWRAAAAYTELEGEVLLDFVTETAAWLTARRGPDAPPVGRVIDIGSGPGVGTCELARRFAGAHVLAVDSSPAMLERTTQRAAEQGLASRITTHLAELPHGLDELGHADVIWASMSLHHVGDEVAALRILGGLLDPGGLIAIAERAQPMSVLPSDLDLGTPGLVGRLERVQEAWYAQMREGLAGSVPSADLATMLGSAGLEVVGERLAQVRLDPPLSHDGRRLVLGHLRRSRHQFHDGIDRADLEALDVLTDPDDPRGVMHRPDVFVAATRQIMIARRSAL